MLALFPPGVSRATLGAAVERVRFQRGLAERFRDGLVRAGQWEPHIRRVFRDAGLPQELASLPHVESSFNPARLLEGRRRGALAVHAGQPAGASCASIARSTSATTRGARAKPQPRCCARTTA